MGGEQGTIEFSSTRREPFHAFPKAIIKKVAGNLCFDCSNYFIILMLSLFASV